jgi:hypothetical protein
MSAVTWWKATVRRKGGKGGHSDNSESELSLPVARAAAILSGSKEPSVVTQPPSFSTPPSQRAMVAAKIATLKHGGDRKSKDQEAKRALDVTQPQAAELLNTSVSSVKRAREVYDKGTRELIDAAEQGLIPVTIAAKLAKTPEAFQRAVVKKLKSGEAKKPMEAIRLADSKVSFSWTAATRCHREDSSREIENGINWLPFPNCRRRAAASAVRGAVK